MVHKLMRYLVAIVMATVGLTVVNAAPAMAVGGCKTTGIVRSCFDYRGGSYAYGDFYLLSPSDSSRYYFRVWIVVDGVATAVTPLTRFGPVGRHGPWPKHVLTSHPRARTGVTRVQLYRSDGAAHYRSDSPSITFSA